MNSNLQQQTSTLSINYKHILLRKLSYAVSCSVISQLIILFWYIFILNFSFLNPVNSISNYVDALTSFGTWVYVLMFSMVVFAQSIICAKDYIITPSYCSTRFSKMKAILSIHNITLLNLHILVGFVCVWLFLGFTSFGLIGHKGEKYFIIENTLYLLYLGAWTGFYYFISIYTSEKKVLFPVVHQAKWLQFKAHLFPLLKKSKYQAFWSTLYFIVVYAVFGHSLNEILPFEVQKETGNYGVYFLAWFFATLMYFSLYLMNFYYELFLTEPLAFPIVPSPTAEVAFTLNDGLQSQVPIIQYLACQDMHLLAGTSYERRQMLFALSNPGNHPHSWNQIVQTILLLIKTYTDCLNSSLSNMMPISEMPKVEIDLQQIGSPTSPKNNLRHLGSLHSPMSASNASFKGNQLRTAKNNMINNLTRKIDGFIFILKEKLGINFIFRELPEANIQKCLGDGQIIVWLVQALSSLCSCSLEEDRYGVVQKDLPAIFSALVELKVSIEKLNRFPTLSRRGHGSDDFNCQMKWGIMNALKRSIYNIVNRFSPYLKDLNLRHDIYIQLQGFAVKNCY